MKRFTIIKNNFEEIDEAIDIFKSLVGNNLEIKEYSEYTILYYSYDNLKDIQNLFLSLADEFMVPIVGYTSSYINLEEELNISLDLIKDLKAGMYDLKTSLLTNYNRANSQRILDFILKSSGIDESFIRDFAACDLNVSRASKVMYVHRNTINYKLDKLKDISGFDLRVFIDAHIIYSLLK